MNVGVPEMLVVLVVALVFLGPTRLPGAARQLGQALRELRRVTGDLQAEVRDAFSDPATYAGPPPLEDHSRDRKPSED